MVQTCIVYKCSSVYKKGSSIKLHRFPKDNTFRRLWFKAVNRSESDCKDHWRVCSLHFSHNDYGEDGHLRPGAVPAVALFSKIRRIPESDVDVHNLQQPEFAVDQVASLPGPSTHFANDEKEGVNKFSSATCVSGSLVSRGTQTSPVKKGPDFQRKLQLKRKIRNMHRCITRKNKKLESISDLLRLLEGKRVQSGNLLKLLKGNFSKFMCDLIAQEKSVTGENQLKEMFRGSARMENTQIKNDNPIVKLSSKKENKDIITMTEIENISKSSTKKILKNNKNMEGLSIQYEKTLKDTEIIESLVLKNDDSASEESNYMVLKQGPYETDNFISPKNEDLASENIERYEQVLLNYEPEFISVKNEITEGLIIENESDVIQIETQENKGSKQCPDSSLYNSTEVESRPGLCAVTKNGIEMGKNIGRIVPFKIEKNFEDICVKQEFSEELIIKDEPNFIKIETQENTYSENFSDGDLHFSTEAESISGPNENSIGIEMGENIGNPVPFKIEKRLEDTRVKKEFTEELIIKDEPNFIKIESQENTYSEKFPDSDLHFSTEAESISGPNENSIGEFQRHEIIYTGIKSYECDVSKKNIHQNSDLGQHKRICTDKKPYACDVCEKTFNFKSRLLSHKNIHTSERPYACNTCEKTFCRKNDVRRHKRIHIDEKPYTCNVCEKTFRDKSVLIGHKIIHTGKKPYACNICKKTFSRKYELNQHKRIHTGEKPYACDVCEKKFNDKNALKRHTFIHTGKRPYVCDICKKSYVLKSDFQNHERIHTGEKPYACDACEKTFYSKSVLIRHKIIHSGEKPYACKICEKTFHRKDGFQKHKRVHTGEKPYACDVCEKIFGDSSSLVKHKISHTGKKPFACNICKKTFSRKSHLQKHERIHTGDNPISVR